MPTENPYTTKGKTDDAFSIERPNIYLEESDSQKAASKAASEAAINKAVDSVLDEARERRLTSTPDDVWLIFRYQFEDDTAGGSDKTFCSEVFIGAPYKGLSSIESTRKAVRELNSENLLGVHLAAHYESIYEAFTCEHDEYIVAERLCDITGEDPDDIRQELDDGQYEVPMRKHCSDESPYLRGFNDAEKEALLDLINLRFYGFCRQSISTS